MGNASVNLPFDTSSDYSERPGLTYSAAASVYLTAWNNHSDGGIYIRRYSPTAPPTPTASFTASPTSGVIPLTVVFTDTSTGTIASRTWNFGDGTPPYSPPLMGGTWGVISHTYLATGAFTATLTLSNPTGSAVASALITVTERTTPALTADFENLDLGSDPTFWLDQFHDTTSRDDFETLWSGPSTGSGQDSRALGTVYSSTNTVYSHYAIPGWAAWQNYEYSGRLQMTNPASGIGLAFYSRYPAGEQKLYALRRYAGSAESERFHLVNPTVVTSTLQGNADTGLTPQVNTWYRFRIQAVTQADRTTLRAKVWAEGGSEPVAWQAEVYDPSPTRFSGGAVGLRTSGPGAKYFDDLVVTPISPILVDFSAFPLSGPNPLLVQFLNNSSGASSYSWAFGDGLTSTLPSPTHTYTSTGVYTVSLVAGNGVSSAALTKTNFITVTSPLTQNWRLITSTISPPVRGEHTLAYDSARNRLILYGGNGAGWPYENSTWEFDGANWLTITTATSPTARYGAAMAYDSARGVTVLFGGSDATDTALNQTWRYTNTTWSQVTITGTVPASRTYASMVAGPSGQLYLFGGNNGVTYYNDLWRYTNGVWTNLTPATSPLSRTLTALAYDPPNNRLLLFGGRTVTATLLADLWVFNLGTSTWSQLSATGGPPGRMAHTLTYDTATSKIVLVGGVANEGDTLLGDTWHYQTQPGWTQAAPPTPLPPRAYHGAVYGGNAIILFGNEETWRYE